MMRRILKVCLRRFVPISLVKTTNRTLRSLSAFGHHVQFIIQWDSPKPPEWFDHFIDLYWKWNVTRNPMSWERGIFGLMAMRPGCRVLDLCCGGGFFAHHFFASRAVKVVSVDFDAAGIRHAKTNFRAPNVEYHFADIRTHMPEGEFDNVAWDAAIEHFTEVEMDQILNNIKRRLTPNGILSGYTIVAREHESHEDHEHEFSSREELANLLRRYFGNVLVISTAYKDVFEERDNLYFYASDGPVPFDEAWGGHLRMSSTSSS